MTTRPYRISGPASIAFSGGRTSGYMLAQILEEGPLPADVHVLFMNTGKEMTQTLDFVQRCSDEFKVEIIWLEYSPPHPHKLKIVDHTTASRNGEPFEALIKERGYLPAPRQRYCSEVLKQRTMRNYMNRVQGYEYWENVVGLRADEPHRVAKIRARNESKKERYEALLPLATAGVTRQGITQFWERQSFDLGLPSTGGVTPLGNCDCCFLKNYSKTMAIIEQRPELAKWWARQEEESTAATPNGRRFRIDRPTYAEMIDSAERQTRFEFGDEDLTDCGCTD